MKQASTKLENLVNLKTLLYLMSNDKQSKIDEETISRKETGEEKIAQVNLKPQASPSNIDNSMGNRLE